MHPILARLERLALYLSAWLVIGVLLATVLSRQGLSWPEGLVLVLPVLVVYAFVCLSAWYVCRAVPLSTSGITSALAASGLAAAFAGIVWVGLSEAWIAVLGSLADFPTLAARSRQQTPFLFTAAALLFLLVLSVHYVALAFEAVREAERQQLALAVMARDAELKALRAQLDPHFLYNCLNSIGALTTTDPNGARRMCLLLGEFLRSTLKVGQQTQVQMAEELALADRFLSIEQVRFGKRLEIERRIDAAVLECRVPPLFLQPLVENAVNHGIAGLLDGGAITLAAARVGDRLSIVVENPCDTEMAAPRGQGMGLNNVRARLAAMFGDSVRMAASAAHGRFRVELDLPYTTGP